MASETRGIFGGTFDPVHLGHLTVARAAADGLQLDWLHLIPTSTQPLKRGRTTASAGHRLAMLRLATSGDSSFLVDDREIRRGGISYTIDTLREIAAEFPDDQLSLLVGADAAEELPRWRDISGVERLARIVVLTRPGVGRPPRLGNAEVLEVPAVPVSASEIRARLARAESIAGLVPESVAAYIASHRLYCVEE